MRTRSVIVIKPDCAEKEGTLSDLISLIRDNSLCIVYLTKARRLEPFWRQFYLPHSKNPKFPDFEGFVRWMASVPLVFMVVEGNGNGVVSLVRRQILMPLREKYQTNERKNGFHASDSVESAEREMGLIYLPLRE